MLHIRYFEEQLIQPATDCVNNTFVPQPPEYLIMVQGIVNGWVENEKSAANGDREIPESNGKGWTADQVYMFVFGMDSGELWYVALIIMRRIDWWLSLILYRRPPFIYASAELSVQVMESPLAHRERDWCGVLLVLVNYHCAASMLEMQLRLHSQWKLAWDDYLKDRI